MSPAARARASPGTIEQEYSPLQKRGHEVSVARAESFNSTSAKTDYGSAGSDFKPKTAVYAKVGEDYARSAKYIRDSNAKSSSRLWSVCSYIICSQFFERIAFYGFSGSFVLFLTKEMGFSSASADSQLALWTGAAFFTPMIGGWIADSYIGRWRAMLIFCGVYITGIVLLLYSSFDVSPWVFFPAAYVVACGSGAAKPLVSSFGADQFDNSERDKADQESFFNWLYWGINMGSFVSYTGVVYVSQNVSFKLCFAIALGSMCVSLLVLLSGSHLYKKVPAEGSSVIADTLGVCYRAVFTRSRGGLSGYDWQTDYTEPSGNRQVQSSDDSAWFSLDRAGSHYSDEQIDAVRSLGKIMPFFFLLVIFWGINAQMTTTFFNMGCQMDLRGPGFTVPVACLSLFNAVVIILLVPVFENLVYPALTHCGVPLTALHKMALGIAVEIAVMIAAGFLEMKRKSIADEGLFVGPSVCVSADVADPPMAVDLSVFYQVPMFVGIGVSEILAAIPAMEFFYAEAPESMKSTCSALELLTVSLGQWLIAGLIPLVNAWSDPWIPSDLNVGHLDRFYFLLAGLVAVNLVAFVFAARSYQQNQQIANVGVLRLDGV